MAWDPRFKWGSTKYAERQPKTTFTSDEVPETYLKVFFIFVAAIFLFGALDGMYSSYVKNECKVAAIEKGMSADDILKLCK